MEDANSDSGRLIAIGDIHGHAAALESILDAILPGPDDTIVTLGDYINRGPDSRKVLDLLIDLSRRCQLIPILGNHEEAVLYGAVGFNPKAKAAIDWTRDQLSRRDRPRDQLSARAV